MAQLAPDDVVDLEYLRLARLNPDIGKHGPQSLAKRFELLPRVPDFADANAAVYEEGDVVLQPLRWKVTGLLQVTDSLVVLLAGGVDGGA